MAERFLQTSQQNLKAIKASLLMNYYAKFARKLIMLQLIYYKLSFIRNLRFHTVSEIQNHPIRELLYSFHFSLFES